MKTFARPLVALLLGLLIVWATVLGSRGLHDAIAEEADRVEALAAADAVARLAARGERGADAGDKARLMAGTIAAHAFCIAEGSVDALGIARGRGFCFGGGDAKGEPRPEDKPLVDLANRASSSSDDALRRGNLVPAEALFASVAWKDGKATAVAVPFRKASGSKELGGAAGILLAPKARGDTATPLLWLLALLPFALIVALERFGLPPLRASFVGFVALGAALWLFSPALPEATSGGVNVLAADMIVPHQGVPTNAALRSAPWALGLATLLLAALCALLLDPIARISGAARRDPVPYLYIGPAMIATGLLVFVPFFVGLSIAFAETDGTYVGLRNFIEVLASAADPTASTHFFRTLGMTVLWTVTNVLFHVSIGLGLALVLDRPNLRGRALYRLLLIVPWAIPSYITALVWKWMFNTQYGPINAMLGALGIPGVDWLGQDVATNFLANLVTNIWLGFPFMMVVSLGALQSIPKELYEAADLDGASAIQRFRHITMPLLKPALFPAIILGIIWTFNAFNIIYLVSGGGPNHQTDILITEAYHTFKVLNRFGLAAAYSVLIFLLLLGYTLVTNKFTKATEGIHE